MILKQTPKDFIVKEIAGHRLGGGIYAICILKKTDYTTERAVQAICDSFRLDRKRIGYAGTKDKIAITEQHISIKKISKDRIESLKLKDLDLGFVGYSNSPLSLGDLRGNDFKIVVRDLSKNIKPNQSGRIKNFFDEQRFQNNNVDIGRAILKKDFKKAVELILENKGDYEDKVKLFMDDNLNNYVSALKIVPFKILLMFIHSYQSQIFNKVAESLDSEDNIEIPLVGFGTEYDDKKVEKMIKQCLADDSLNERDFIIRSIPSLSSEGSSRFLYTRVQGLKIGKLVKDDLNKGMFKCLVEFSLPKGSYATNVIKEIFS